MKGKKLNIIILVLFLVALSSCNINRYVPEGKYLVKKNTVVIEEKNSEISKSKLSDYIALKPYKSFIQSNIPLWIYYQHEKRSGSKFWKWMDKSFGKEPVYYDRYEADRSSQQMMRYLDNIGYFHSKVSHSVSTKRKRAKVKYIVEPAKPYRINHVEYVIGDSLMEQFIMRDAEKFNIEEGDIYNAYTLSDQREMITERLKNSGYYFFNRDNIRYEIDSNFMDHSLSVTMKVSKNKLAHERYNINKISIFPNYSVFKMNDRPSDSASMKVEIGTRKIPNILDFYYFGKPNVKPNAVARSVQIVKGRPFNQRSVTSTYKSLSNFALFNNVNISFDTVPHQPDSINLLDCKITMQQNNAHSYSIQAEGTKSDSDLGIRGSLSYTNRNIFKGAEMLQISVKGGLEAQSILGISDTTQGKKRFNTREFGISASLVFPKFLSPVPMRLFTRDYQPTTSITLGYNSQVRYYYSRYMTTLSFSYDWKSSPRLRQTLSPVYLNSVKISNIDPVFQHFLDLENNQRKKDQYTDHLIFGLRYALVYSTQSINKQGSFFYLRADFETSGNLLSLFNNTKLVSQSDNHHEIAGIRYAQYVRTSFDIREHIKLNETSWLVLRQCLGVGLPYGNSEELPFERSFYAGGANSMRGWSYHNVGPGGFNPMYSEMEKIGDLLLELNAEYRFPIYNIFNGAIFADLGNIWTLQPNPSMPDCEFKPDTFYKQLAFDAGFGLRLDVSFLILRLDLAYALRNPYADNTGNYWRFNEPFYNNLKLQWGIGYPF